ncbi:MAG: TetR/AcrR family transcriptional regulator, partial [Streptosporangiales bacterium]
RAQDLSAQLFERVQRAGAVRADLVVDDLSFIFEQLAAVRVRDAERTRQIRERYLTLFLQAIGGNGHDTLPGPPPTWPEIAAHWQTPS